MPQATQPTTRHGSDAAAMPAARVKALTFRCEQVRAVGTGILESAASTFLVLIAVGHFHSGATAKGLLAGAFSGGMLLSPLVVHAVARRGWRTTRAAAAIALSGALVVLAPILVPGFPAFVVCCVAALVALGSYIPLITQMYQDNYPEGQRGRLYSQTNMIRLITSAGFAVGMGWLLKPDLGRYAWLLLAYAAALALSAGCLARCPSGRLTRRRDAGPLHALHWVRDDPTFRLTLIVWMLMGFSNLMMLPLRVEYLVNPKYGLNFTADSVAMLTVFVPALVRIALSPLWGRLFDRVNFFRLRIAINVCFALGVVTFFTGDSVASLLLAAVFLGVANSGSDVAWNLWVTKLARAEHVAEYMSVHTFFTGLRGLVAPLLAFHLARSFSMAWLGVICGAMMLASSALLIPEARGRRVRAAPAPMPEDLPEA